MPPNLKNSFLLSIKGIIERFLNLMAHTRSLFCFFCFSNIWSERAFSLQLFHCINCRLLDLVSQDTQLKLNERLDKYAELPSWRICVSANSGVAWVLSSPGSPRRCFYFFPFVMLLPFVKVIILSKYWLLKVPRLLQAATKVSYFIIQDTSKGRYVVPEKAMRCVLLHSLRPCTYPKPVIWSYLIMRLRHYMCWVKDGLKP